MDKLRDTWRRKKQKFLQGRGKAKFTADDYFVQVHDRFEVSRKRLSSMADTMYALELNVRNLLTTMSTAGDQFVTAFEEEPEMSAFATRWQEVMKQLEASAVGPITQQISDRCLNPFAILSPVGEKLVKMSKERSGALLDYDARRNKLAALHAKPKVDPVKEQRYRMKEYSTKDIYERLNQNCIDGMQDFDYSLYDTINPVIRDMTESLLELSRSLVTHLESIHEVTSGEIPENTRQKAKAIAHDDDDEVEPLPSFSALHEETADTVDPTEEIGDEFFYLSPEGEQISVDFKGLKAAYAAGTVDDESYVFGHNMSDWQAIKDLPTLRKYLA